VSATELFGAMETAHAVHKRGNEHSTDGVLGEPDRFPWSSPSAWEAGAGTPSAPSGLGNTAKQGARCEEECKGVRKVNKF